MARSVGQRHEHLPNTLPALPDVVLDDGVPAVKPVFVSEPLVDALGGVALLPGDPVILFEDAFYDAREGLKFGPARWALSPVARRR